VALTVTTQMSAAAAAPPAPAHAAKPTASAPGAAEGNESPIVTAEPAASTSSARVPAGPPEEKILADVFTAVTRYYIRALDLSGSARRVLWWHHLLFRTPATIILQAAERKPSEDYAALDSAARALFEDVRFNILERARAEDRQDGWQTKLPGLILRVAGILSMIDHACADEQFGSINRDQTSRAVRLVEVFSAHRRRVIADLGTPSSERMAAELAGWVVRHRVTEASTFELRRGLIPGIRSTESLRRALIEMNEAGWIDPRSSIPYRSSEPLPKSVRFAPGVETFFAPKH
jgi:hypothetical protein